MLSGICAFRYLYFRQPISEYLKREGIEAGTIARHPGPIFVSNCSKHAKNNLKNAAYLVYRIWSGMKAKVRSELKMPSSRFFQNQDLELLFFLSLFLSILGRSIMITISGVVSG